MDAVLEFHISHRNSGISIHVVSDKVCQIDVRVALHIFNFRVACEIKQHVGSMCMALLRCAHADVTDNSLNFSQLPVIDQFTHFLI